MYIYMKIYLQEEKLMKISPDTLKDKAFVKYIHAVRHFKRIFSEESILIIENESIQKMAVNDKPIEYGKIQHYADHDYYHKDNILPHAKNVSEVDSEVDSEDKSGIMNEFSVIIDKSIIYYDQVYHIPPRHVSENIVQYIITLQNKSRIKMILEMMNDRLHDMYFLVPDNINIQDTCSPILSLVELVKIK
jgi:hypothetical protein